jgi:hypothetical protein
VFYWSRNTETSTNENDKVRETANLTVMICLAKFLKALVEADVLIYKSLRKCADLAANVVII